MNKYAENWVLDYTGKIIFGIGIGGIVLTFNFDRIARGVPNEWGWLQFTGVMAFFLLSIFGLVVDGFLRDVKDFIK